MSLRFPVLCCLTALAVSACGGPGPSSSPRPAPTLVAGAVTPSDPEGYRSTLESLRGTPVVVNYWASWCGPCSEEMPLLAEAARTYEGRVHFLGVNSKDFRDAAREFIERFGVPFPSLGDPEGEIMRAERVLGLPVTKFYRTDGALAFVSHGEVDQQTLTHRIEELLRVG